MSQKYTLASGATATDRLKGVLTARVQLSDGTYAFLAYDPNQAAGSRCSLNYSSDHSTVVQIALVPEGTNLQSVGFVTSQYALVVDNLDNLYVIGPQQGSSFNIVCIAYVKGSGYTWTKQTDMLGGISAVNTPGSIAACWCNTGGGTNNKGHILVFYGDNQNCYAILNAGVALAGTGTLVTAQARGVTLLGGAVAGSTANSVTTDLDPDGFGATSGLAVAQSSTTTTLCVGAWAVSNTGTLSTNTNITTTLACGTLSATSRLRCIRVASNVWAVIYPSSSNAGRWMIARYSASAQLTAGVDSGTPTGNMPTPTGTLSWDAALDPVTAGKVWVYGSSSLTATTMLRLGCLTSSGVTWDAAATVDDTAVGAAGTNSTVACVKQPRTNQVDWDTFNTNGGTTSLLGDYTGFAAAPNAPTLGAPANNSYQDLAAGFTFTWTYNPAGGSGAENAWAMRRKISGAGSYEYWNSSTAAWQGTIVWNTGSATSVVFAAGKWTNGNVYNWSVATQESNANLQGPFAADFTVNAQNAPTLVVNGPSGTISTTATPTVTWTPTPAGGAAQTTYRLVVFTAAQYGIGGFDPNVSPNTWDSGTVSDAAARARTVGVALANGGTYRAYMIIAETGGQTSTWQFVQFNLALDIPAVPAIVSVTVDNTNGQNLIVVQARDNLLTTDDASAETTVGTWVADTNMAAPVQSTTFALDGTGSIRLSSTAAGDMIAKTGEYAVQASTQYTLLAAFRSAVSARSCQVGVEWRNAAHAIIGARAFGSTVTDTAGAWTALSFLTVVSPVGAAFAVVLLRVQATGGAAELHYADEIDIGPGASLIWTRGGLLGATTLLVEYSDNGTTWTATRAANGTLAVPAATQTLTVLDKEVVKPNRQYRATILATV